MGVEGTEGERAVRMLSDIVWDLMLPQAPHFGHYTKGGLEEDGNIIATHLRSKNEFATTGWIFQKVTHKIWAVECTFLISAFGRQEQGRGSLQIKDHLDPQSKLREGWATR